MPFQHFILTPFYTRRSLNHRMLPLAGNDWLEARLDLFERYCAPSIAAQTEQNFEWLVFFDPATPPAALERFRAAVVGQGNVHVCFCDEWTHEAIVAAVRDQVRPDTDWILSTRFDNDDGLHEEFVDRLQREVRVGTREFLNYTTGYIVANERAYLYRHASNAFISASEPLDGLQTPFITNHERLSEVAPIRQIEAPPFFYQMVHGGNFSNKVRGTRVLVTTARRGFANLRFALPESERDPVWKILFENTTLGILRNVRDLGIKTIKRMRAALRPAPASTSER